MGRKMAMVTLDTQAFISRTGENQCVSASLLLEFCLPGKEEGAEMATG